MYVYSTMTLPSKAIAPRIIFQNFILAKKYVGLFLLSNVKTDEQMYVFYTINKGEYVHK